MRRVRVLGASVMPRATRPTSGHGWTATRTSIITTSASSQAASAARTSQPTQTAPVNLLRPPLPRGDYRGMSSTPPPTKVQTLMAKAQRSAKRAREGAGTTEKTPDPLLLPVVMCGPAHSPSATPISTDRERYGLVLRSPITACFFGRRALPGQSMQPCLAQA